jgi:hypothetical protein
VLGLDDGEIEGLTLGDALVTTLGLAEGDMLGDKLGLMLGDNEGDLLALGEVDGVDAFKKRSEVTMKVQSMEEVEKELLSTLSTLKHKAIDVEAKEIKPKND